jgi:linker between RRM2 and RRM3 domains in RBM39 protein
MALVSGSMTSRGMGNQAESLDEGGNSLPFNDYMSISDSLIGGNLNAVSRQALMQKLARVNEPQLPLPVSAYVSFF